MIMVGLDAWLTAGGAIGFGALVTGGGGGATLLCRRSTSLPPPI